MGLFDIIKRKDTSIKGNDNKINSETELQQALSLSRAGKHMEAYPIFEKLYNNHSGENYGL